MRLLIVAAFLLSGASVACGRDRSMTRGADDSSQWNRRLAGAVSVGISRDSARAILERNGFRCELDSTATSTLWCDKESSGRFAIVRRRWQALFSIQDGRIATVKGTTALIGP